MKKNNHEESRRTWRNIQLNEKPRANLGKPSKKSERGDQRGRIRATQGASHATGHHGARVRGLPLTSAWTVCMACACGTCAVGGARRWHHDRPEPESHDFLRENTKAITITWWIWLGTAALTRRLWQLDSRNSPSAAARGPFKSNTYWVCLEL